MSQNSTHMAPFVFLYQDANGVVHAEGAAFETLGEAELHVKRAMSRMGGGFNKTNQVSVFQRVVTYERQVTLGEDRPRLGSGTPEVGG